MTFKEKLREAAYRLYVENSTRFYKEEPSNLTGLKRDGFRARAEIDAQTDARRDFLLERALIQLYPDKQAQDC